MQLSEQIHIDYPPEMVLGLLVQDSGTWLVPFLRIAGHIGEAAGLAAWQASGATLPAPTDVQERRVSVSLGRPMFAGTSTVMRMSCRTSGYSALFRELSGSIEVAPAPAGATVVTVAARCRASGKLPPGATGRRVSQRAARGAVLSLLGNLRTALEELGRREPDDAGEVDARRLSRL